MNTDLRYGANTGEFLILFGPLVYRDIEFFHVNF